MSSEDDKSETKPDEAAEGESKALARPGDAAGEASEAGEDPERMDLPKWNRARVKRKAPKGSEQDAFQGAVRQAGKRAVRSAPLVIGVIALLAAGIGGAIWWTGHRAEKRAEATRILAEAAAYRARGQIGDVEQITKDRKRPLARPVAKDEAALTAKVQKTLDDLHEHAPGSGAATMAHLVRGAKLVEARSFSEAEAAFRKFLEAAGPRHELAYLAREGIVAALEGQGDVEGALAQAEDMIGKEGDWYRDQALWHKARLLEKLGRTDDALEVYRQYAVEYPLDKSSIAWQQVRRRLAELDPSAVPAESPVSPVGDFP